VRDERPRAGLLRRTAIIQAVQAALSLKDLVGVTVLVTGRAYERAD